MKLYSKNPSLIITLSLLIFVVITSLLFFVFNIFIIFQNYSGQMTGKQYEQIVFMAIVFFILYGNIVYFLTRFGNLKRTASHRAPHHSVIDSALMAHGYPSVTILVPSYKEEREIILMTVLSVLMQPYPRKKIVLLIDDPPNPTNASDEQCLRQAREIPGAVWALIEPLRAVHGQEKVGDQLQKSLHEFFAEVRNQLKDNTYCQFFVSMLKKAIDEYSDAINEGRLREVVLDLQHVLDFELVTFERKQFENLSHEPNKAMNLNSYIALMGKKFSVKNDNGKICIQEDLQGQIAIPDTDFVLTLDADSMLCFDYLPKLMHYALLPGNERLAVVQTPYCAFPTSFSLLERVAGMTTDIQHLIHQGFTYFNATYWVGANALIRKSALEDIKHQYTERGFTMYRYVHDRTVIEDTESSIDLLEKGWRLYNYPERLAYSATPPDFGSLIVQRRRWANGGIIIFPKLVRHFLLTWQRWDAWPEFFVRAHYLLSIAGVNIGLLLLIFYPFERGLHHLSLVIFASVPYFICYAADLKHIGYRWRDVLSVYALNLLLIPVNISGVTKSIQQGVTMKKIPFGRTPKINDRTTIPIFYILFELLLTGYLVVATVTDALAARWAHATFSLLNGIFFLYGFHVFIGFSHAFYDIARWIREFKGASSSKE